VTYNFHNTSDQNDDLVASSNKGSPPIPKADDLPAPVPIKRLTFKIPKKTTVGEFKKLLQVQLQQVAGFADSEEIEVVV